MSDAAFSDTGRVGEVSPLDGRSLRRERNAERLYEAANTLLADGSFEDISVDDICALAGVGRATFFRIYETKAGLLREFNRRLADDARQRLEGAPGAGIRDALEQIRGAIIDAWRHAGRGHVGMAQEFIRSAPNGNLHAAHPELLDLVLGCIADAVRAGELPGTVPVDLAASLALVNMTAPVAYVIAGNDVDLDELSRTLLDQWYAGMQSS